MTVFVRADIGQVAVGDHRHTHRKKEGKQGRRPDLDTDRVWAFECRPACERQVVAQCGGDHGYVAAHAGGVPLSLAEQQQKADLESKSRQKISQMTEALAGLADERVRAGETGEPAPAVRRAKAKA